MFWSVLVVIIVIAVLTGFAAGAIGHTWRLARVAMTLVRYDVLLPSEYYDRYPTSLQATHTILSIFAKRRRGRTVGGGSTIVYFSCQDCGIEAARIEPAGGKLHMPKTSIGQYGAIALGVDTEGNVFGLHNPPSN